MDSKHRKKFEDGLKSLKENQETLVDFSKHFEEKISNKLGDADIKLICQALQSNAVCKELNLGGNRIGNEGVAALGQILKHNFSIEIVNLDYNQIGKEGAAALAEALKDNNHLLQLHLKYNQLGKEGAISISHFLAYSNSLQVLNLYKNQIGKEGAIALAQALKKNFNLLKLYLYDNQIGKEGAIALAQGVQLNNTLELLDLENNEIEDEGACAIAVALHSNYSLTSINLDANKISDNGALALSDALKNNQTLITLSFRFNDVGTDALSILCQSIECNQSLEKFYVHDNSGMNKTLFNEFEKRMSMPKNRIHVEYKEDVWTSIKSSTSELKILRLYFCSIKQFPSDLQLSSLSNLSILDLRNNDLKSEAIQAISQFMQFNFQLKSLILQNNKSIGDLEGRELLTSLSLNVNLQCLNLIGTSVSLLLRENIQQRIRMNSILEKVVSKIGPQLAILLVQTPEQAKSKLESCSLSICQEAMFISCSTNRIDLCEFLLDKDINVNYQMEDGNTYLHVAVMKDNLDIVKLLLSQGANTLTKNRLNLNCREMAFGKCFHYFNNIRILKVSLLGSSEVGKSTLIRKMMSSAKLKGKIQKTDGIEMHEWNIEERCLIHFWDFAGSEIFHHTNPFFISDQNLIFIFFKLNQNLSRETLSFWLNLVQWRAPGAKVVLVGSFMDLLDAKLIEEECNILSSKIFELYASITQNIPASSRIQLVKCYEWFNPKLNEKILKVLYFWPISSKHKWNFEFISRLLINFSFNSGISSSFQELCQNVIFLREKKKTEGDIPLVLIDEIEKFLSQHFLGYERINYNLKLLQTLGYIICIGNKHAIIEPQWLVSLFKSIYSFKSIGTSYSKDINRPMLVELLNLELFPSIMEKKKSIRKKQNVMYIDRSSQRKSIIEGENEEVNISDLLIEILEKYCLCIVKPIDSSYAFNINDSCYIFPPLLNSPKPRSIENLFSEVLDKENLSRKYSFSFLPNGIFEHFLCHAIFFLGSRVKYWKNGFSFEFDKTNFLFELKDDSKNGIYIQIASTGIYSYYLLYAYHFSIQGFILQKYPSMASLIQWKKLIPEVPKQQEDFKVDFARFIPAKLLKEESLACTYYLCHPLNSSQKFTIKRIKLGNDISVKEKFKSVLERETEIVKSLSHPNIIKFVGRKIEDNQWILLFDYYDATLVEVQKKLFDLIPDKVIQEYVKEEKMKTSLLIKQPEYWWKLNESLFIIEQVLNGIEYLHSKWIAHLDIKAENIFVRLKSGPFDIITNERPVITSLCLVNFTSTSKPGVAFKQPPPSFFHRSFYTPPECNVPQETKFQTIKVSHLKMDIFSFGILCCEIIVNDPSLYSNKHLDQLQNHKLEKMIQSCLTEDSEKRPTSKELLATIKEIQKSI